MIRYVLAGAILGAAVFGLLVAWGIIHVAETWDWGWDD